MNQNRRLSVGALLAACWLFLPSFSHLFAQGGSLTPPGAPAPTMKTLDQVEARKPIGPATASVAISAPGSYYLAGDIVISNTQGGINITSGDVTLDLNGFAIRKAPGGTSGTAINVNAPADNSGRNITIRNGHISGTFDAGIALLRAHNVTLEDLAIQGIANVGITAAAISPSSNILTVRRCRVLGDVVDRIPAPPITAMATGGIAVQFAMACVVEDCVVANVAGDGIRLLTANSGETTSSGIIRGCVVSRCGDNGIDVESNPPTSRGVLVERCTADQCGGEGITVSGAARIVDCTAVGNTGNGIATGSRLGLITGCVAENNLGNGIRVGNNARVINNTCEGNGNGAADGAGILVTGADCHIEGNRVSGGDRGIDVTGAGNFIIKNTATGNATHYSIVANNKVGVIVNAPNSVAISGTTGGAGVGTTDPWANFSY